MPIEIRELKIKVTVDENNRRRNNNEARDLDAMKNRIVKECMDKILARLNNLSER
ncbi:MAG: hypothetical protein JSU01_09360 [Bacteroidetes bacterium]|nr:hypothetical protein [Bacteroidota bacterium]